MEFNRKELADYFQISENTIKTNFPKLKARMLKKGYLITKRGTGELSTYEVEKTEPKIIDYKEVSSRNTEYWSTDFKDEQWVDTYCNKNYEVSNYGRVRYKKDLSLRKSSHKGNGYFNVSIDNKNYTLHRVVLKSFQPVENEDNLTVDHIDGNRSNNCLSNLRWLTNNENTMAMLSHRKEFHKELTRLLQKYSYEEILEKLRLM